MVSKMMTPAATAQAESISPLLNGCAHWMTGARRENKTDTKIMKIRIIKKTKKLETPSGHFRNKDQCRP